MDPTREFRERLRRELPVWQAEGIVTPGAARALQVRYELDRPGERAPAADRSGPLAAAAGVTVVLALAAALLAGGEREGVLLPFAALAAAFAAAPLVVRGEALAPPAAALRALGRVVFYLAAWTLSFPAAAEALRLRAGAPSPGLVAALPAFLLAAAAVLSGIRRVDVDAHARGEAMLLVATVIAFAAGLALEGGQGAAIVANLALAFLGVGRIVRGVSWLARGPFWEGLAVVAVLVASRILDLALPAWLRGAGAVGVGLGALAAGLAFERRRARAPRAASAAAS